MPRLRKLSVFTLALVLTSSAAMAIPRHEPTSSGVKPAVSAIAEPLISRLLGWLGGLWTKAGCGIDPSGQCVGTTVAPPQNPVDAGSSEGK